MRRRWRELLARAPFACVYSAGVIGDDPLVFHDMN
jgi:hypothetical protein